MTAAPAPAIALRPAEPGDCERVWAYNFAPDVRAVSATPSTVTLAEHHGWYGRRLADPRSPIWIVEADGVPCGVVRIDARAGEAGRISIALDTDTRGRGVGRLAIRQACVRWAAPVIAAIQPTNLSSRACFVACGFAPIGHHDHLDLFHWSP